MLKRAMILAAGLGIRMRPITHNIPKPLIRIAGRPMLEIIMSALVSAGIEKVVINIHHLPEQMKNFINRFESPQIILSDETECLLESGGGVKKAIKQFENDPFFVLNSDSFWIDGSKSNIRRLYEAWYPKEMDVLLLLACGPQITGYMGLGDFVISQNGKLTRRANGCVAPFIYAGVAIIKPELFLETPDEPFSLNLIFDRAMFANKLFGLRLDGEWMHVGTPDAIQEAEFKLIQSIS